MGSRVRITIKTSPCYRSIVGVATKTRHELTLLSAAWLACAATVFGWAISVHAQAGFPTRPVRMVNPYTPGGSVDLVDRAVAAGLSEIWGQIVTMDNRPGAATLIGTEVVVRAEPDGYTVLCTSSTIAIVSSTE